MTTATKTRPRKAPATAAADTDEAAELRHYSIEQVCELLGVSKRWLAGRVAARTVRCTFIAGQTRFTAAHIRELSAAGEIDPAAIGRQRSA
ncbi:hypothetical protein [Kitasatospora sp. MBT63]|uniref:hypothetical protein n=1 Tax=Kitasatospora sp. MBT63 TaxID=1444768 RepID=UPI00053AB999|nr:hypothetical protein [Kitasatospora sp. MBT63]